jgi:hypothetical protein
MAALDWRVLILARRRWSYNMNRVAIAAACFAVALGTAEPSLSEDMLAKHKIRALKGLKSLAIVLRPGGSLSEANARLKEWATGWKSC